MVNQAWATTSRSGGISAMLSMPPTLATAAVRQQGRNRRLWTVGLVGPGALWTTDEPALADDLADDDLRRVLSLPAQERVRLREQRAGHPRGDEGVVPEPEDAEQHLGHEVDRGHDVEHAEQREQEPRLAHARVPPGQPELEHPRDGGEVGADPRRPRPSARAERPREHDESSDPTSANGHRRSSTLLARLSPGSGHPDAANDTGVPDVPGTGAARDDGGCPPAPSLPCHRARSPTIHTSPGPAEVGARPHAGLVAGGHRARRAAARRRRPPGLDR